MIIQFALADTGTASAQMLSEHNVVLVERRAIVRVRLLRDRPRLGGGHCASHHCRLSTSVPLAARRT